MEATVRATVTEELELDASAVPLSSWMPSGLDTTTYSLSRSILAGQPFDADPEVVPDADPFEVQVRDLELLDVDAPDRVGFMYAIPSDRKFRDDYLAAINFAIAHFQHWLLKETGDITIAADGVDLCRMPYPASHYAEYAWTRVESAARGCVPTLNESAWVIYADVQNQCDAPGIQLGAARPLLAILPRADLDGIAGYNQPEYFGACGDGPYDGRIGRWIGGMAHELGHVLRLVHPPCASERPSCQDSLLMSWGYSWYPNTRLSPYEKAALRESPFAGPVRYRRSGLRPWLLN